MTKEILTANAGTWAKNGEKFAPKNGYMVAMKGFERVLDISDPEMENQIKNLIRVCPEGAYIGKWVHEGKVYLDISKYYTDLEEAIWIGIREEQLAIFDFKSMQDIVLPERQKSGTMTQQVAYLKLKVREIISKL